MAVTGLSCDGDSFGIISYNWYYHIRPGKIQLFSVVPPTKLAQAISSNFQPKHSARAKLAGTNNKNGCDRAEVWWRQFRKYFISLILSVYRSGLRGPLAYSLLWCGIPTQSIAVVFLDLYDNINDMKYFWNFCYTPQPCHSHCSCWLLSIWP